MYTKNILTCFGVNQKVQMMFFIRNVEEVKTVSEDLAELGVLKDFFTLFYNNLYFGGLFPDEHWVIFHHVKYDSDYYVTFSVVTL